VFNHGEFAYRDKGNPSGNPEEEVENIASAYYSTQS